jgi:DNA-binding transcriptional MerR regulator
LTKGPDAFRTISEAADELGVAQHVLRFWETKFSFIRPMKRAGGRRFYRPQDIAVLRGVRSLLHDQGYTIKGVQRLHREEGVRRLVAAGVGAVMVAHGPVLGPEEPPQVAEIEAAAGAAFIAESVVDETPPWDLAPVIAAESSGRRTPADLTDTERRRLRAMLEDLIAIKAEIDGLLVQGQTPP